MSQAKKLNPTNPVLDKKWEDKVQLLGASQLKPQLVAEKPAILVTDDLPPEAVLLHAINHGFTQIVQEGCVDFEKEINSSALMLSEPDTFFSCPISSILQPEQASPEAEKRLRHFNQEFSKARQKQDILSNLKNHLDQKVRSSSYIAEILNVADELVTNAIFNAPFSRQNGLDKSVDRRNQSVEMHPGKNGRFFFGADDSRMVVGCLDPYGSLQPHRLFEKVVACYQTGLAANMNMGAGGAGIGAFMIYNSSASYYAYVKKDMATLVCCVWPVNMSSKRRALLPKNLHYIILGETT